MNNNSPFTPLSSDDVCKARERIEGSIISTPILTSGALDEILGTRIFCKMESQQKTGSFKIRGALNAIKNYFEKYQKYPARIVTQSSGNHAFALANICYELKIPLNVFMIESASPFKINAVKSKGANVSLCKTKHDAMNFCLEEERKGALFIHPSDNDDVITGQGTIFLECEEVASKISAIMVPIGGGGLVGGAILATKKIMTNAEVFACEPLLDNDAAQSFRLGHICSYEGEPTIADGARIGRVSERTFYYLKHSAGVLEVSEEGIKFWQKKFLEIFNCKIEPTAALSLGGAEIYLKSFNDKTMPEGILVVITGQN